MSEENKVLSLTKELVKSRIEKLKEAFTKNEIPEVDSSECLFINGKYYNIIM